MLAKRSKSLIPGILYILLMQVSLHSQTIDSIQVIKVFPAESGTLSGKLVFSPDGSRAVIVADKKLFVAQTEGVAATWTWNPIVFADKTKPVNVEFSPWFQNRLIVMGEGVGDQIEPVAAHTLMYTDDWGATFTYIDQQFLDTLTIGNKTYYSRLLCSSLSFVEQAGNKIMVVNAGGGKNIISDMGTNGAQWKALNGRLGAATCYENYLASVGNRIFSCGECSMDMAFIEYADLNQDGNGLISPITKPSFTGGTLGNRYTHGVYQNSTSNTLYVGAEGAILRSTDRGVTFSFALKADDDGTNPYYPYVYQFTPSPINGTHIFATGFDSPNSKGWIGLSSDDGVTWMDFSNVLPDSLTMVMSLVFGKNNKVYAIAKSASGSVMMEVFYSPGITTNSMHMSIRGSAMGTSKNPALHLVGLRGVNNQMQPVSETYLINGKKQTFKNNNIQPINITIQK